MSSWASHPDRNENRQGFVVNAQNQYRPNFPRLHSYLLAQLEGALSGVHQKEFMIAARSALSTIDALVKDRETLLRPSDLGNDLEDIDWRMLKNFNKGRTLEQMRLCSELPRIRMQL